MTIIQAGTVSSVRLIPERRKTHKVSCTITQPPISLIEDNFPIVFHRAIVQREHGSTSKMRRQGSQFRAANAAII